MPALEDLARDHAFTAALRVPAWTLGCFIRRSIAYATGAEDRLTKVVWVQSHSMTGDLRIPPDRPTVSATDRPEDMDLDTLCRLVRAEGAAGDTFWSGDTMSWHWWCSYQPYDKWPEPAVLRRVGSSMIEFAPSGIYVEDWRHQPSAGGAMAGLTLIAESDADGAMQPRRGALILAGRHAILCRDRRTPLPQTMRAQDYVAAMDDPLAAYRAVADCVVDFAEGGTIAASTDPWREGAPLDLGGFEPLQDGELIQRDGRITRRWRVVSLGAQDAFPVATEAEPDKLKWLARESDTLLAAHRMAACAS